MALQQGHGSQPVVKRLFSVQGAEKSFAALAVSL